MNLKVAERLHPFSHRNGATFLLPKSLWKASSFPTRLVLSPIEGEGGPIVIDFDWVGPIGQFTTELDLERSSLRVWGKTKEGFMRYSMAIKEDGMWIHFEKIPKDKTLVTCSLFSFPFSLSQKEYLFIPNVSQELRFQACASPCIGGSTLTQGFVRGADSDERLSLGHHRMQEWERMKERLDLSELIPLWLRIGQQYTGIEPHLFPQKGGCSLLDKCHQLKKDRNKQDLSRALEELFLAAFEGCLIPRFEDTEFQGILPKGKGEHPHFPLSLLLGQSAQLIRSLFFQEVEGKIHLLPCLLPEFHCGRYLHLKTQSQLEIDFEWTKKCLRQIVITGGASQEVTLVLPKGLSSCRLCLGKREKRRIEISRQGELFFPIASGQTLLLDIFEA